MAVDIPPGIADGQRIRLTRRGHAGQYGGPAGRPLRGRAGADDERFLRDAEDLVTVIDVPAPLAALGTTVQVPTLDGDVSLEIPAGTQPGETIVMRGAGCRRCRAAGRATCAWWSTWRSRGGSRASSARCWRSLPASITEDNLRSDEGMLAKLKRVLAG